MKNICCRQSQSKWSRWSLWGLLGLGENFFVSEPKKVIQWIDLVKELTMSYEYNHIYEHADPLRWPGISWAVPGHPAGAGASGNNRVLHVSENGVFNPPHTLWRRGRWKFTIVGQFCGFLVHFQSQGWVFYRGRISMATSEALSCRRWQGAMPTTPRRVDKWVCLEMGYLQLQPIIIIFSIKIAIWRYTSFPDAHAHTDTYLMSYFPFHIFLHFLRAAQADPIQQEPCRQRSLASSSSTEAFAWDNPPVFFCLSRRAWR